MTSRVLVPSDQEDCLGYTGWVGGAITGLPMPPSEAPTEQGPLMPAAALHPRRLPLRALRPAKAHV